MSIQEISAGQINGKLKRKRKFITFYEYKAEFIKMKIVLIPDMLNFLDKLLDK